MLSRSFFTNWSSRPDGAIPALLRKLQESVPETAFNGFTTLVYTPGEKEWQDCPNPDGRLPAIRRISKDTPNLTRLETYPGFTPQWVKATVNPSSPGVFSFMTVRG